MTQIIKGKKGENKLKYLGPFRPIFKTWTIKFDFINLEDWLFMKFIIQRIVN